MRYLLFIHYNSGLKHNAVYENISILFEGIKQLVEEVKLRVAEEKLPTISNIKKHFKKEDDYFMILSDGTSFHIQELSERNYII
ncbi:MAG: hypothetical protein QME52_05570 [Bacteroidota bacterium]|nr:hypothetical protein [Bacteroidota bacterium]